VVRNIFGGYAKFLGRLSTPLSDFLKYEPNTKQSINDNIKMHKVERKLSFLTNEYVKSSFVVNLNEQRRPQISFHLEADTLLWREKVHSQEGQVEHECGKAAGVKMAFVCGGQQRLVQLLLRSEKQPMAEILGVCDVVSRVSWSSSSNGNTTKTFQEWLLHM